METTNVGFEPKTVKVDAMELPYTSSFYFHRLNRNWSPSLEYNVIFLRAVNNYLNDLYRAHGYLFLNDVYEQLGAHLTGAGQVLGWIYGETADAILDFEIPKDGTKEYEEGMITIHLNPMGIIVDQIDGL